MRKNPRGEVLCHQSFFPNRSCPQQVPIPDLFAAMNKRTGSGQPEESQNDYDKLTENGIKASNCIECGQCESVCPQHISIIRNLKECSKVFEG